MEINNDRCPLCPEDLVILTPRLDTWMACDICELWYHNTCIHLTLEECDRIDQYHCPKCEPTHGPSTYKKQQRKSSREHIKLNYADLDNGLAADERLWAKLLASKRFAPDNFRRMRGEDVTLQWVRETGMREPFVVETPEGLDMRMPDSSITVRDVTALLGGDTPVDVIDVATQAELTGWTLSTWAAFFHDTARNKIRNVISLEVSGTELAKQIVRPRIVRELDWTDHIWPAELKKKSEYPKVQLYCLMSVFYHILSGSKIFYFIPPTEKNLKKYERWSSSSDQPTTFLGDEVKECYSVELKAGNTMIIPTGWIHAVYTASDSLVIGGNFLHGFNIATQLRVYEIEQHTNVPQKFRFPWYERMCWYAGERYANQLKADPSSLSKFELDGIFALAGFLVQQAAKCDRESGATSEERKWVRSNIPATLRDPTKLASTLKRRVRRVGVTHAGAGDDSGDIGNDGEAGANGDVGNDGVNGGAPEASEAIEPRPEKVKLKIPLNKVAVANESLSPIKQEEIATGPAGTAAGAGTRTGTVAEAVVAPMIPKVKIKVVAKKEEPQYQEPPAAATPARSPTPPVAVIQKGPKLVLKVDKRKISTTSASPPQRVGNRSVTPSTSSSSSSSSSSSTGSDSGDDRLGITSALASGDYDYRDEDEAFLEHDRTLDEDVLYGDDGGEYGAPRPKKNKAKRRKSEAGGVNPKRKRPAGGGRAPVSGGRDETDSSDDGLGTKSVRVRKEVMTAEGGGKGEEKRVKGDVRHRLTKVLDRLKKKR
ncbi:hypothetical protein BC937DRAFT_87004 [Endogone sp. FLAS-F59071]|nr:hypothetical protein BC937DRAFT_87004 [Endogone sp. FLAS-F59071]|eukprot:RUS19741.1 hypothetical protein BC937DRAFT_87004 [Endogone sp. FLAS-F59071]